ASSVPPPPPANDAFANAQSISGSSGNVTGSNANATKESGEPNHAGNAGGRSVWYAWTAPTTDPVTIQTVGSSFDTLLAVYTGSAVNALSAVASNDNIDTGNLQSRVTFTPVAGTVYRIAVDGFNGANGNLSLAWNQTPAPPPAPANDAFANAQSISGSSGNVTGSNANATKESGEPNHAGNAGGRSVWYAWTAPTTDPVTIQTVGSSFDTLLAVYTGSAVNALSAVASNDNIDTGNLQSRVTFTPVAGTVYRIAVDGFNGASGNLSLAWSQTPAPPPAPANDAFANTQSISGSSGNVTGSNANATKESGEPNHAGNSGGRSVWYAWTAPTTDPVTIQTVGSVFDTLLAVYTGSAVNALSAVASNDNIDTGNLQSRVTFTPVAGTVYRIAVDGFNGASGTLSLAWNQTPPPPPAPANDAFVNAQSISGASGNVTGSNANATKVSGEPYHAGNAGGRSVWYYWTAPGSGSVTIDTVGSTFNTLLGVYTGGSVSGLTTVASNDDISSGSNFQSRVTFSAVSGTTYRIAVDGSNGASGSVILNWSLTNPGPLPDLIV